ncbi:hypothetical protein PN36_11435 [Candidatus Thiomargarita nelsonii]|uniref:MobA-like NTP transferase domain-containing protein n=1 Tax=Candidatus Thiomargarita nelsonii TaxID=1003181 RepID=A0A4E0RJ94_9GAMM|nr:hypothetical protein PN36_11435 [Candidatus Thiomargarita nelsonii]
MKAIILAAGPSCMRHGFPIFAKPKCLYHYYGHIILENNIRVLNACGINDIRVVVGYKHKAIKKFCQEKNLNVEIVFNRNWKNDAVKSLLVGIENVTDDILLLEGDNLWTDINHIKNVMACQAPLVRTKLKKPWGKSIDEDYRGDVSHNLCKMTGEVLADLTQKAYQYKKKYTQKYAQHIGGRINDGSGIALGFTVIGFFINNKGLIGEVSREEQLPDLDYYWQTDEYKNSHFLVQLKSRGYNKLFKLLGKLKIIFKKR